MCEVSCVRSRMCEQSVRPQCFHITHLCSWTGGAPLESRHTVSIDRVLHRKSGVNIDSPTAATALTSWEALYQAKCRMLSVALEPTQVDLFWDHTQVDLFCDPTQVDLFWDPTQVDLFCDPIQVDLFWDPTQVDLCYLSCCSSLRCCLLHARRNLIAHHSRHEAAQGARGRGVDNALVSQEWTMSLWLRSAQCACGSAKGARSGASVSLTSWGFKSQDQSALHGCTMGSAKATGGMSRWSKTLSKASRAHPYPAVTCTPIPCRYLHNQYVAFKTIQ